MEVNELSMTNYDFAGRATCANVLCSDGRTILPDAFKHHDGERVPLVWNHQYDTPESILGTALLHCVNGDVFAYCAFNNTKSGETAKELVRHSDICSLSICANQLKHNASRGVMHGIIRELSLVVAGANPKARIESVKLVHGDGAADFEDEIHIYTEEGITLHHSFENEDFDEEFDDEDEDDIDETDDSEEGDSLDHSDDGDETVEEVWESMTPEEQRLCYLIMGADMPDEDEDDEDDEDSDEDLEHSANNGGNDWKQIWENMSPKKRKAACFIIGEMRKAPATADDNNDNKEENEMKHNAFETGAATDTAYLTLDHQRAIIALAKENGGCSLQHAIQDYINSNETLKHSFVDEDGNDAVSQLFPDHKWVKPGAPELVERDLTWVDHVMRGVHKSPISRIRTRFADARAAELNAKGYNDRSQAKARSGNIKLISRTTDPQTVYRTDEMHRDDIIDITDFDVVAYKWKVMEHNLHEELALAFLIGDGRDEGDKDKIHEEHIRSIWNDDDLYTIHYDVDVEAARKELQGTNTSANFGENYIYAEAIITAALYAREKYKGKGALEFYCTPHLLNVMLLARDLNGRRIYSSKADLAAALNVKAIHTVEQFEGKIRTDKDGKDHKLLGLFVNLDDYHVGATKGGEITRFDQFDINFNKYLYLIETRLSGAMTNLWSAIALEEPVEAEG